MDVVFSIGGREAIPVRAIPFLIDWDVLTPDVLAKIFAGEDDRARRLRGLQAFRLEGEAVVPMTERAWGTASADLHEFQKKMAADGSLHRDWRSKATAAMPAGVFVWKDEFERSYDREYGKNGRTKWNPTNPSKRGRAEWDYRLNFRPLVPPELEQLVAEGFDRAAGDRPTREPLLRAQERRIMETIKALGFDPLALPVPRAGQAGVKAAVKKAIGNGPEGEFTAKTAFKAAWDRLRKGSEIEDAR